MSDKILPNPSALKSGDVVPPSSRQGSFRSCTWCAAKDAQIAALEAKVERLRVEHTCPDCGQITTNRCLADLSSRLKEMEADRTPFVALARVADQVVKEWRRGTTPSLYLYQLADALAHPAVQRAVKEVPE